MTAIQAVCVRAHEERPNPKPHTVYRIEIQASVRSWQMWRRYSEFLDLHTELTKSTGSAPPCPLPPKHTFSFRRSLNDEKILEERTVGLEAYLRAMIGSRDGRWRETLAFKEFLGVPIGKASGFDAGSASQWTYASWLDEHTELQSRIRGIRADINKRDALSNQSDISAAHTSNVQAKKKLAAVLSRLGALGSGVEDLAKAGMSQGEVQRRTEMVARVQDECEKLGKMVSAIPTSSSRGNGGGVGGAPASDAARGALLGTSPTKPAARVFGKTPKPKETDQTRPLDDQGVFQLQQVQMDQQDVHVSHLSAILQRQKQLSIAIGNEIAEQNEMLDGLNDDADRFGVKLSSAKRQMNKLG